MQKFIAATSDPFFAEVWYHDSCRKKYLKPIYDAQYKADEGNLRNINEKDIEQNFINYVNDTIIEDKEPKDFEKSLQGISRYVGEFCFFRTIKCDCMKELLRKKFSEDIGFHSQIRKNKSEIVYSRKKGNTYYEAILNGSEISDQRITRSCFEKCLNTKLLKTVYLFSIQTAV